MKLYHGSNVSIDRIDLKRGRRGKDFGRGFYLSTDFGQAMLMARRTVAREEEGKAIVSVYEVDEKELSTMLNVKRFEGYTREWAEFVMMNRQNRTEQPKHDYDVVYGPIADDRVGLQISRYQLRYIQMDELIRQLQFLHPTFQYFFGTERALAYLHKVEE